MSDRNTAPAPVAPAGTPNTPITTDGNMANQVMRKTKLPWKCGPAKKSRKTKGGKLELSNIENNARPEMSDTEPGDDLDALEQDPSLGDGDYSDDEYTTALKASAKALDSTVNLDDCVCSDLYDIISKHGRTAEVAEAVRFSLTSIKQEWGDDAVKNSKAVLILEAEQAVRKDEDEFVRHGQEPKAVDQKVRYEVGDAIRAILHRQDWSEKIEPKITGITRKQHRAVDPEDVKAFGSLQAGMDAVGREMRTFLETSANTLSEDMIGADQTSAGPEILSLTPVNGPAFKPPKLGDRISGPPKGGRLIDFTTASSCSPTGGETSTTTAPKSNSKLSKPSPGPRSRANGTSKKPTKADGRKSGYNHPWSAKEELNMASKWWLEDLTADKVARKPSGYSDRIPCAVRAAEHNDWILQQGGDQTVWYRTWDGMEQHVKELKKRGETRQSIALRAAKEDGTVRDSDMPVTAHSVTPPSSSQTMINADAEDDEDEEDAFEPVKHAGGRFEMPDS